MRLSPLAVALQGAGYGTAQIAAQGLLLVGAKLPEFQGGGGYPGMASELRRVRGSTPDSKPVEQPSKPTPQPVQVLVEAKQSRALQRLIRTAQEQDQTTAIAALVNQLNAKQTAEKAKRDESESKVLADLAIKQAMQVAAIEQDEDDALCLLLLSCKQFSGQLAKPLQGYT